MKRRSRLEKPRGKKPTLSSYAIKLAARRMNDVGEAVQARPSEKAVGLILSKTNKPVQVKATVTNPNIQRGCAFLTTQAGVSVFLSRYALQRYCMKRGGDEQKIYSGDEFVCDIAPHPNGKGPQVVHIHSITPAKKT